VRRYSTVRTNGKRIVRSDLRQSPDALRAAFAPPLLPEFERSKLDFGFFDRGLYNLPPFPPRSRGGNQSTRRTSSPTTKSGMLRWLSTRSGIRPTLAVG
jgi:hypothetical protein